MSFARRWYVYAIGLKCSENQSPESQALNRDIGQLEALD